MSAKLCQHVPHLNYWSDAASLYSLSAALSEGRGKLCPHLGCCLSRGRWWRIVLAGFHLSGRPCIPHAFTRLALSKLKYTFSKIHTFSRPNNSNARTCSRGCGWHSNKDPSLSKETKPPLTAFRWPGPFPRELVPWLSSVLQALETHACWEPIQCSQAVSPT